MKYNLKEVPEKVYWSDTKQFTIVDEEGKEYDIRIGESSKNTEYFMWHEPGGWDDIEDRSIIEYLNEEFADQEGELEYQKTKEEEKLIQEAMDKFIKENGEIKSLRQFDDMISEMMRVQNYDKTYYERFYHAFYRAKLVLKFE